MLGIAGYVNHIFLQNGLQQWSSRSNDAVTAYDRGLLYLPVTLFGVSRLYGGIGIFFVMLQYHSILALTPDT